MVYHFVILNKVKELFTSTLCLQILRKAQNDSIISVLTHFYMQMIEVMMKAGYPFCSTSSFSGAPGSSRSVGFRGLK